MISYYLHPMSFVLPPKPITFQNPPFYIYVPQTLQAVRSQSDSLIHGPRPSCPAQCPLVDAVTALYGPHLLCSPTPTCWLTLVLKVQYCPFHTGTDTKQQHSLLSPVLQLTLSHKMHLITSLQGHKIVLEQLSANVSAGLGQEWSLRGTGKAEMPGLSLQLLLPTYKRKGHMLKPLQGSLNKLSSLLSLIYKESLAYIREH
jgi:hypothetical protein